jgi:hypothetical protein
MLVPWIIDALQGQILAILTALGSWGLSSLIRPGKRSVGWQFPFGYVLIGLAGFLSLVIFQTAALGTVAFVTVGLVLAVKAIRKGSLLFPSWEEILFPLLAYLSVLVALWPMAFGFSASYKVDAVFDVPKHVAAIVSVANASSYPTPNPYYPNGIFAYNIGWYMPIGGWFSLSPDRPALAHGLYAGFAAVTAAWLVYQGILIAKLFRSCICVGFIAGAFSWLGLSAGYYLSAGKAVYGNHQLSECGYHLTLDVAQSPIVYAIFVPQHGFAVSILLTILAVVSRGVWVGGLGIMVAVLLVGSVVSSFLVGPFVLIGTAIVFLVALAIRGFSEVMTRVRALTFVLIGFVISSALILIYKQWSDGTEATLFAPVIPSVAGPWIALLASFGVGIPLVVVGALSIFRCQCRGGNLALGVAIIAQIIAVITIGFFVFTFSDGRLKAWMCLVVLMAPMAAIGFDAVIKSISSILSLSAVPAITIMMLPILMYPWVASLLGYVHLYPNRTRGEATAVAESRGRLLPVLRYAPDQEWAAAMARLCTMDFAGFRLDRYLPPWERRTAGSDFQVSNRALLLPMDNGDAIYCNYSGMDINSKAVQLACGKLPLLRSAREVLDQEWELIFGSGLVFERQGNELELSAIDMVDACVALREDLIPGVYHIMADYRADITGVAHFSLLSQPPIIRWNSGLQDGKIDLKLVVFEEGGRFVIGFGGFGLGRGKIVLKNVQVFHQIFIKTNLH